MTKNYSIKKSVPAAALYAAYLLCEYFAVRNLSRPYMFFLMLGLTPLGVFGAVKLIKRRLDAETLICLIFLAAVLIRITYSLYTDYDVRQHDVGTIEDGDGHLAYLEYILGHGFRFPALDIDPQTVKQFYHPPLNAYISAVWVSFMRFLGLEATADYESIQALTVFYSTLTLAVGYGILKELNLKKWSLAAAFGIIAFSPPMIIMSGGINNDALMLLLQLSSVLCAIRWYKEPTRKKIIACALLFGFAELAKTSAALSAPAIAVLFLARIIGCVKDKQSVKPIIAQLAVFAVIAAPISLSYILYCRIRWGMPLFYVLRLPEGSYLYVGDYTVFQRFFCVEASHFENIYPTLFLGVLDYNIPLMLLKQGVFEECTLAQYSRTIIMISRVALAVNTATVLLSVISLVRVTVKRVFGKKLDIVWLALMILYVTLMISFIKFCFEYPYTCTCNIRYILPTVLIGAAALGLDGKFKKIRLLSCGVFCGISFLLMSSLTLI